jgi:hypothetical protein
MNSNDDALATAVQESVSGVHMTVPVEQIISRSRARRSRRRLYGTAGALAAAAAVALPTAALLPSGHVASARLDAWTVAARPDGNVTVTIRELRDPAGLQARLRADGIPASIEFPGHNDLRACRIDNNVPNRSIEQVFQNKKGSDLDSLTVTIRRSAIPSGAGILIRGAFSAATTHHSNSGPVSFIIWGLVHVSPQCTGS